MAHFRNAEPGDLDAATQICELKTESNRQSQKAGCETWSVAWSADNSYFAWSQGCRMVKVVPWNEQTNTLFCQNNNPDVISNCDAKETTIDAGELVWSLALGRAVPDRKPYSVNINFHLFDSSKGLILATGLASGRIRTWDVFSGKLKLELIDHTDVIRDLKFAPDGSLLLASACRDGSLKIWDLNDDGNMMKTLRSGDSWLYGCAWSPNAKMLAAVGASRTAVLWDMENFTILHKLKGHHHSVVSVDFSPDGALLVTTSYDTRALVWDPYTGDNLLVLGHLYPPPRPIFAGGANDTYVRSVSFSQDGVHAATVADDRFVRFWNVFNEENPEQIALVLHALCCEYSPDGSVLAVGTRDGNVSFWKAPMKVQSLQHMCRMSIRRVIPSTKVDMLCLPIRVKEFLKYRDNEV